MAHEVYSSSGCVVFLPCLRGQVFFHCAVHNNDNKLFSISLYALVAVKCCVNGYLSVHEKLIVCLFFGFFISVVILVNYMFATGAAVQYFFVTSPSCQGVDRNEWSLRQKI